ncbi:MULTISPECIES: DUF262 domain-containing protein [Thermus]|uniref:GmrSD restriction endonucleases N-terminal domain-containing protein n=1 Tax=Thermus scotoductus (strain ATCC 700910 / SA-01) TaxID=743525 RepID=E8PKN0_THESS|nr:MULTISPECIES: DUF262 domain-containing protein [Thermus]ADW22182.1 hypothetical protein TSC_c15660 [Thermus scotoductus SA-01]
MSEVLFRKVDYTVEALLNSIELGNIGLPDIQRPFVWKTTRVRDLFDSMYRGFPIGYLLFWENGLPGEYRVIGAPNKQRAPTLLIVDGQQRLTSLYAVIKGVPIVDEHYRTVRLRLAFHPLEERFEVTNPAIERDPEWLADISVLWQPSTNLFTFVNRFIQQLSQGRPLPEAEAQRVYQAIGRLVDLRHFPLTALEISSKVTEAQVAEIFVRINSRGTPLNQADFILTLMSVFWDEGRRQLELFCRRAKEPAANNRSSPYNSYFHPTPDQLLRASVALGFRRARLEHVYSLLRGKDLQTGEFSEQRRDEQFDTLRQAQAAVLDLSNWHELFNIVQRAGYIHRSLITSETTLLYTYALWLIGKRDFQVDPFRLRELMAQWLFMASLTGRYTGSPETRMEQDLALLRNASSAEDFVRTLQEQITAVLTRDYWEVTLPNELATASAQSTSQSAFYAALCLLDAPVLYSKMTVREMLSRSMRGPRSALERHHLFPREYLKKVGIEDRRDINQVANYTLVEWRDNAKASDRPPAEYAPALEERFTSAELARMYELHGLPEGWYRLPYTDFLAERRRRMAGVIRRGFERLQSGLHP